MLINGNSLSNLRNGHYSRIHCDHYRSDSLVENATTLLFAFLIGGGQRLYFYQLAGHRTNDCRRKDVALFPKTSEFLFGIDTLPQYRLASAEYLEKVYIKTQFSLGITFLESDQKTRSCCTERFSNEETNFKIILI